MSATRMIFQIGARQAKHSLRCIALHNRLYLCRDAVRHDRRAELYIYVSKTTWENERKRKRMNRARR